MMNVCERLQVAKRSEANTILEYNKLKNIMSSDQAKYIDTIDTIIAEEYDHLTEFQTIIAETNCSELFPIDDICIVGREIYERANNIERLAEHVDGEDGKKIKQIAETIENQVKQLKAIVKK